MQITEIFKSIQGESTYAGLPCIFVRLTGCNLRCTWCDTAYAFHGGTRMTVAEVLDRVKALGGSLVEVTGGEPLLQTEVYALIDALLAEGFDQHIEKGYIYFAMGFSMFVEMINLRMRTKAKPVHLHSKYTD